MRKEHEEILIKDLTARLPYDVKVWVKTHHGQIIESDFLTLCNGGGYYSTLSYEGIMEDSIVKPYLRPMSSMTEEEKKDWRAKVLMSPKVVFSDKMAELYDFCNSHYLDYRKVYDEKDGKWKSMIEMGLAIEAPKDMYTDKM
jgi:hypothetical protein